MKLHYKCDCYYNLFIAGYYTRSGYVPGPVCKYNWTKTWDIVKQKNNIGTRIFSYLTKDEGELFPGKLACENRFVELVVVIAIDILLCCLLYTKVSHMSMLPCL